MGYNEDLDLRIRDIVGRWPGRAAKKMFGGVCHLWRGHMVAGVHGDHLIVRLGPEGTARALAEPHVRPFDLTGRPMKGWVMVHVAALGAPGALEGWLARARAFVETLPPKA
ncbi:TfoX/Sxy family protein [Deferrisoma sp.]